MYTYVQGQWLLLVSANVSIHCDCQEARKPIANRSSKQKEVATAAKPL